ncbi:helix-turn-helix transcriptional regulator [Herpetosiphon gulosus]|uniref:helix-turn-helix domain-containing protein n=1 Tax=Herpetosiphon gulosus TaxID=1973496 RepID=UPI0031EE1574
MAKKIQVTDLSKRTNISQSRISAIKNNPYINRTSDTIARFCEALGISLADFGELVYLEDSAENSESKIELAQLQQTN